MRGAQEVGRAGQIAGGSCGCGEPNVKVDIQQGKSGLGRGEWKLGFTNKECFPVFVTLAVQEKPGCKDFDTNGEPDRMIRPGETITQKLAKDGNGVPEGAEFRLTVKNQRNVSIGVVHGVMRADRC